MFSQYSQQAHQSKIPSPNKFPDLYHQESLALKGKLIYECGRNNLKSVHEFCDTVISY